MLRRLCEDAFVTWSWRSWPSRWRAFYSRSCRYYERCLEAASRSTELETWCDCEPGRRSASSWICKALLRSATSSPRSLHPTTPSDAGTYAACSRTVSPLLSWIRPDAATTSRAQLHTNTMAPRTHTTRALPRFLEVRLRLSSKIGRKIIHFQSCAVVCGCAHADSPDGVLYFFN